MKDELNPKIWNKDFTINTDVRKNLLKIAKDFVQFVKIKNLKISDIILTGSIANYNWHSKSDIDLHVVVDLSNFGKHSRFIDEYLQTKKALWNQNHDIEMFGFEVEIYPEDKAREQKPTGLFSLAKNKWLVTPEKKDVKVDKELVKKKYQGEVDKILQIEDDTKKKNFNYEKVIDEINKYKLRWREKRSTAIREEGEFSVENLVFKMLRNNGFLEKLTELKRDIYDNALTLERFKDNITEYIFSKGDKFKLNKDAAKLHGRLHDRFKVVSNQSLTEGKMTHTIRNLRTRKDYEIETHILQLFANKNFLTKETR
jgi:hypothetical protein